MDLYDMFSIALKQAEEQDKYPQLNTSEDYIVIYTEDHMAPYFLMASDHDFSPMKFYGETKNLKNGDDELVFIEFEKAKQFKSFRAKEYGSRWVCVDVKTPLGNLLVNEYNKIISYLKNKNLKSLNTKYSKI